MKLSNCLVAIMVVAGFSAVSFGGEDQPSCPPGCTASVDRFFANEVWAKVAS